LLLTVATVVVAVVPFRYVLVAAGVGKFGDSLADQRKFRLDELRKRARAEAVADGSMTRAEADAEVHADAAAKALKLARGKPHKNFFNRTPTWYDVAAPVVLPSAIRAHTARKHQ
jgi:hypothetical protein